MHEEQFGAAAPFGPATERSRDILNELDRTLLKKIKEMGGLENYVQSVPELKDAFNTKNHDLCCMDERTAKGALSTPGSGILIEGDQAQQAYIDRLKKAGVEGVYSHNECGAAKIYAKEHGIEDDNAAAIAYSKDLAEKLGVAYKGHLKSSGIHPGRAVYYDTTGQIDRGSNVWQEKMPTGFSVSRNILNEQEAEDALVLAVKLAFGSHGHGANAFSEQDPLSVIYISKSSENTFEHEAKLKQELAKAYQRIEREIPEAKGRIHIEGIEAPIQKEEGKELEEAA